MKWVIRILILIAFLALVLVGITVVRLVIGDGPPTCVVNFDGTTYPEAVRLHDSLEADGFDASLEGQRGGSSLTVVLTVKDDQLFFYENAADLRRTLTEDLAQGDGGKIVSCTEGKLG